jgi:hypothetical protein
MQDFHAVTDIIAQAVSVILTRLVLSVTLTSASS